MAFEAYNGLSREEVLIKFQQKAAKDLDVRGSRKAPGEKKKFGFDFGDVMKLIAVECKNSSFLDGDGGGSGDSMGNVAGMLALMQVSKNVEAQKEATDKALAFGMAGKEVTVKGEKNKDGTPEFLTGVVKDVVCTDNKGEKQYLYLINGKWYEERDIVGVGDSESAYEGDSFEYSNNTKQAKANLKAAEGALDSVKKAQRQLDEADSSVRISVIKNTVDSQIAELEKLQRNTKAEAERVNKRAEELKESLNKLSKDAEPKERERLESQFNDAQRAWLEVVDAKEQISKQLKEARDILRGMEAKYY